MQSPRKGAIAVCSIGALGLITSDAAVEITYPDNTKAAAWTGIHLTNRRAPLGSPWASREPIVLGYIEDITLGATAASWQESALQVLLKGKANVRGGDLQIVNRVIGPAAPPDAWLAFAAKIEREDWTQQVHKDLPRALVGRHKHTPGVACRGCWDLQQHDKEAGAA